MQKFSPLAPTFVAALALTSSALAAPRQIVLVVAEGANPAATDLFTNFVQKTYDQDEATGLATLKAQPKSAVTPPANLSEFAGLLKTAAANGYKTGLVTTGDVATVAPIFYGLPEGDAAKQIVNTPFDFIAGGGRSHFVPQGTPGSVRTDASDLGKELNAAGGTAVFTNEALTEETKGKVLALQADNSLSYALDHGEDEAALSDLVTQAEDSLSADAAPYVLVVHDNLLAKAITSKDTPAAAEQFHELNGIIGSLLDQRDENPADFALAVLTTGGNIVPQFTTNAANERNDALFILSNLPVSFTKAGTSLKDATGETLDEFAQEKYIGWKLSSANRSAILNGTLAPEDAVRASYEPALRIEYTPAAPQASAFVSGLPATGNLAQILKNAVASKPGKPTPTA